MQHARRAEGARGYGDKGGGVGALALRIAHNVYLIFQLLHCHTPYTCLRLDIFTPTFYNLVMEKPAYVPAPTQEEADIASRDARLKAVCAVAHLVDDLSTELLSPTTPLRSKLEIYDRLAKLAQMEKPQEARHAGFRLVIELGDATTTLSSNQLPRTITGTTLDDEDDPLDGFLESLPPFLHDANPTAPSTALVASL